MSPVQAIVGATIFDGEKRHQNAALLCRDGLVEEIVDQSNIPTDCSIEHLAGGLLAPGFIDLQVNGGGGVLFNEQPDVDAINTICASHRQFGTTSLLPTLITDGPKTTKRAIDAGRAAAKNNVPGFLGLHLEGPHLSQAKKGAHDSNLIRAMSAEDLKGLVSARRELPYLMITVAPESVTNKQIARLTNAGIVVSLGHTNTGFDSACKAIDAGARAVTHLFNAMSGLDHREPGLVGAALQMGEVYAGLIADGVHVNAAALSIALRAKKGPGNLFLVTDAMSTIGTEMQSFALNGRTIKRQQGRLTLQDGTLAGADLDMISAVRYMVNIVGIETDEAIRMASLYPARCMKIQDKLGHLLPGTKANMLHLDSALNVQQIWIDGIISND